MLHRSVEYRSIFDWRWRILVPSQSTIHNEAKHNRWDNRVQPALVESTVSTVNLHLD